MKLNRLQDEPSGWAPPQGGAEGIGGDVFDFQVWFFENDNHLEVHFGPGSTDPGTYGYPVATNDANPGSSVKFLFDTCSNALCLNGPADSPSFLFNNLCIPNYNFIDGTPSDGITYVLKPLSVGINEIEEMGFKAFPNPASEFLIIEEVKNPNEILRIDMIDFTGNRMLTLEELEIHSNDIRIPIGSFADGIYFLRIHKKNGTVTSQKIIKEK